MPKIVIIAGCICAGKTTLRKEKYFKGFVNIDASDIFLDLCKGEFLDFPSIHEIELENIGSQIANEAINNKANIAIEIIGDNMEILRSLIKNIKSIGYEVEMVGITCDLEESIERNYNRNSDDVSAYFTQVYQIKWVMAAIQNYKRKDG